MICDYCKSYFIDDVELEAHEQYMHGRYREAYHINHTGSVSDLYKKYYILNGNNRRTAKQFAYDDVRRLLATNMICPDCDSEVTRFIKYGYLCEVCKCGFENYIEINPTPKRNKTYGHSMRGVKTGTKRGKYVTKGRKPRTHWTPPPEYVCAECGKTFKKRGREKAYCSDACKQKAYRQHKIDKKHDEYKELL